MRRVRRGRANPSSVLICIKMLVRCRENYMDRGETQLYDNTQNTDYASAARAATSKPHHGPELSLMLLIDVLVDVFVRPESHREQL